MLKLQRHHHSKLLQFAERNLIKMNVCVCVRVCGVCVVCVCVCCVRACVCNLFLTPSQPLSEDMFTHMHKSKSGQSIPNMTSLNS